MNNFRIITAALLFLQGSIIATEIEVAIPREIASDANEVIATTHSRSTSPVGVSDKFPLLISPESFQPIDRFLQQRDHRRASSIDSASFSLASIDSEFSPHSAHGSIEKINGIKFVAGDAAKQKLKAALERVGIFKIGSLIEYYEAANEHTEVKQALTEAELAKAVLDLNRELTPAEERYYTAFLDFKLAFVKAKVYGQDGGLLMSLDQLSKEKLIEATNQHPAVEKAYRKILEEKRLVIAERKAAVPEALQNVNSAIIKVANQQAAVAQAYQKFLEEQAAAEQSRAAARLARSEFEEVYREFLEQKPASKRARLS